MERLAEIIGPAPSEMVWEDALHRVMGERERVRGELEYFRSSPRKRGPGRSSKGPTKAAKRKKFVESLEGFGAGPDDLMEIMRKAMEDVGKPTKGGGEG